MTSGTFPHGTLPSRGPSGTSGALGVPRTDAEKKTPYFNGSAMRVTHHAVSSVCDNPTLSANSSSRLMSLQQLKHL